jgi:hypothetical protein
MGPDATVATEFDGPEPACDPEAKDPNTIVMIDTISHITKKIEKRRESGGT